MQSPKALLKRKNGPFTAIERRSVDRHA